MSLHPSTPPCLIWPSDDRSRAAQAKLLPRVLFGQLRAALQLLEDGADEDHCPSPALLFKLWEKRPSLALDRSEIPQSMLADWLEAYCFAWQQEMISLNPDSESELMRRVPPPAYVRACAVLLRTRYAPARITVPIAVVNGKSSGRVQWLHLDLCPHQGGECFLHPEAEFTRQYFEKDFIESIERAWKLASLTAEEASSVHPYDEAKAKGVIHTTVFWHITETDGRQVIDDYRQGTSASAAAFRAFWHIRRGLCLDSEVYVLGSCAEADGMMQDVGGTAQKIAAVREYRPAFGIQKPATLVVSSKTNGRSQHDATAIAQASSWAVVHQVSTLAELTAVRSCESTAAISYLRHLSDSLDQCRLLPMGKRLSEVHVPPQVWKDERIRPEHEMGWRDEPETDAASGPAERDERDSPPKKRRVRQPWERVFQMHRGRGPLVLVGGPGSGKSTVLHWTAREMARESIAALESRASHPAEVSWPVLLNLDTWAAHEPKQQARTSLISLITSTVPEDMPTHEREAVTRLITHRLSIATDRTYLFFDALDQVAPLARGPTLVKRLAALGALTCRLVLTTRESGLSTHNEAIQTLPPPTIVQSAPLTPEDARTLAAKWLGPEQAARLERHLRSHPSLSIVADSPLLLTLTCLVASQKPGLTLPETPAALYQEMTLLLAQGRWRNGDDAPPASHDPQSLLDQLPAIAWRLFVRSPGVNRFDRETMLEAIRQSTALKGKAATDFLDLQLVELGFVEASHESKTEPQYKFRHTTLLEFLAARHLATTVHLHTWAAATVNAWQDASGWHTAKVGDLLDAQAFEPAWEPVIIFTAGQMQEPLPLIEMLADRNKDDLFRHRMGLFCKCFGFVADGHRQRIISDMPSIIDDFLRFVKRITKKFGSDWQCSQWNRCSLRQDWLVWLASLLRSKTAIDRMIHPLLDVDGPLILEDENGTLIEESGLQAVVAIMLGTSKCLSASAFARLQLLHPDIEYCLGSFSEGYGCAWSRTDIDELMRNNSLDSIYKIKVVEALLSYDSTNNEAIAWLCSLLVSTADTALVLQHMDLFMRALAAGLRGCGASHIASELSKCLWLGEFSLTSALVAQLLVNASHDSPLSEWSERLISDVIISPKFYMASDLKYKAAQHLILGGNSTHQRNLGISYLRNLIKNKGEGIRKASEWVDAAIWLVENFAGPVCHEAEKALLEEAQKPDSEWRQDIMSQFLETGRMSSLSDSARKSVVALASKDICRHNSEFGPIFRVSIPGIAEDKVDMALFNENPEAVMRVLYRRSQGPSIDDLRSRQGLLLRRQVLANSQYWRQILSNALSSVKSISGDDFNDRAAWAEVLYGASGIELVELLHFIFNQHKTTARRSKLREILLELYERGWRLRLRGRKIEVLRRGQEEPRSDVDFGC